jgi:hypothetical protein
MLFLNTLFQFPSLTIKQTADLIYSITAGPGLTPGFILLMTDNLSYRKLFVYR